jgi:hypothetical protein
LWPLSPSPAIVAPDVYLGYDKHDPAGRNGQNSRNGTRSKTVLTQVRPMDLEVPRDRDCLTTGQVAAHFASTPCRRKSTTRRAAVWIGAVRVATFARLGSCLRYRPKEW